jgi:hypothetical protein
MGGGEDELLDEQVQAPPDQVGEEEEELPGDDTSSLRVDNLPASGNYRIGSKSPIFGWAKQGTFAADDIQTHFVV